MNEEIKNKGTWWQRFIIRLFTVIFALLIYWLLGFLVEDIQAIPGPSYQEIEQEYIDKELVEKKKNLKQQLSQIDNQIANQTEKQRNLSDSSRNIQQTMSQLLELKKLSLEKGAAISEAEESNYSANLELFLQTQKSYQKLGQSINELLAEKQNKLAQKEQLDLQIAELQKPAEEEYEQKLEEHHWQLALMQLAILLPILLLALILLIKMRQSIYYPLFLAFGIATLLKVAFVMEEYFPSRYFKYIFIGALLLAIGTLLARYLRSVAYPKVEWLLQQYREGYERFLCPVCEYPIRIGPRRFLFWTRRTVNNLIVPNGEKEGEESYFCPCCGNSLYEACPSCQKIRHSLLPSCSHCGTKKDIGSAQTSLCLGHSKTDISP